MFWRRLAAFAALALGVAAVALLLVLAVVNLRRGVLSLALMSLAVVAAWQGLVHRGVRRALGLAVGAVLAAAVVGLLFSGEPQG